MFHNIAACVLEVKRGLVVTNGPVHVEMHHIEVLLLNTTSYICDGRRTQKLHDDAAGGSPRMPFKNVPNTANVDVILGCASSNN
jgi:hypothetical protein